MNSPVSIVIGIVKNAVGEIFITRRHENLHQGGLWEFAGGKVEKGETLTDALARELKEEIGIAVICATPLICLRHAYAERTVQLHVFLITQFQGEPQSQLGQEWAWVNVNNLNNYAFPAANKAILTALRLPPYYAILNDDGDDLLSKLKHLLAQNIKLIQARLKNLPASQVRDFLLVAYSLCQENGALLLVNSGTNGAFEMPCDGVHLTSQDLLVLNNRPEALSWLSASCHNLAELKQAEKIGVDFVVLAPVLATQTHPDVKPLGWEIFSEWVGKSHIPVYALGGVTQMDLSVAQNFGGQGIAGIRTFL